MSRRRFLRVASAAGISVVVGCSPGRDAGPAREMWITPGDRFYRRSYKSVPAVDENAWRLSVDGLVARPLSLTLADLTALPPVTDMRTLECIGNGPGGGLIGNAWWTGVRLSDLLEQAGAGREAVRARLEGADGYMTTVDVAWIMQPDVLMAYAINDAPLPADLGYPLRILIPGLYGQKNPKWITRIQLVDHVELGFWEQRGWSDTAEVRTHAHISSPRGGADIAMPFKVQGLAWAGKRRITQVDVALDEVWRTAELLRGPGTLAWTQWYATLSDIVPGTHTLKVRATDEQGYVQTAPTRGGSNDVYPNGNAKIHEIVVKVR